jgi:diaminohydroxyphosphoribosylaminopyrimidine deaminase/5-amino-6-(5-phosphoribosylamino)uracil reductase
MPGTARVLTAVPSARALVVTTVEAPPDDVARLKAAGAEVEHVAAHDGRVDLKAAMTMLGRRGVTSVFIEPGGTLLAGLLAARVVNELIVFVAPKLVGGLGAPTPLGGIGIETMDEALELHDVAYEQVGCDLMITASPSYPAAGQV